MNEIMVIAAFIIGVFVGVFGTAWCVSFGIRSGYAIRNENPRIPLSKSREEEASLEFQAAGIEDREEKKL